MGKRSRITETSRHSRSLGESILAMANKGSGKGGGNAHDRAMAKARMDNPIPDSKLFPRDQAASSDLAQSVEQASASRKKPNIDRAIGVISLLLACLLFLFQEDGVELSWGWSLCGYLLLGGGCVWSLVRHAIPHLKPWKRIVSAVIVGLIVESMGAYGTINQYRHEHPSPFPATDQSPTLAFDAEFSNSNYPGQKINGQVWKDEYANLLVTIRSTNRFPIVNLDFTANIATPDYFFIAMEQASSIPGVDIHVVGLPDFPDDIRVYGKDGTRANPKPDFDEAMQKATGGTASYHIVCPRFDPQDRLLLRAFTNNYDKPSTAPNHLRIVGSYETALPEGGKRISFDQVITVEVP
jgi:hypothetical protein